MPRQRFSVPAEIMALQVRRMEYAHNSRGYYAVGGPDLSALRQA
jgi:hypothetical protein